MKSRRCSRFALLANKAAARRLAAVIELQRNPKVLGDARNRATKAFCTAPSLCDLIVSGVFDIKRIGIKA
jgi:hypothetical protein